MCTLFARVFLQLSCGSYSIDALGAQMTMQVYKRKFMRHDAVQSRFVLKGRLRELLRELNHGRKCGGVL